MNRNTNSKTGQLPFGEAVPERETLYGIYGLTECDILLNTGRARIRIPFREGTMSGHGIVPATFATRSRALKQMIERSEQFLSGRIRKIR